jgi:hypothetical protein
LSRRRAAERRPEARFEPLLQFSFRVNDAMTEPMKHRPTAYMPPIHQSLRAEPKAALPEPRDHLFS